MTFNCYSDGGGATKGGGRGGGARKGLWRRGNERARDRDSASLIQHHFSSTPQTGKPTWPWRDHRRKSLVIMRCNEVIKRGLVGVDAMAWFCKHSDAILVRHQFPSSACGLIFTHERLLSLSHRLFFFFYHTLHFVIFITTSLSAQQQLQKTEHSLSNT